MAPLVPDIISPEFNLMVALIVGVGFGYALEQAGFSSSRKLVGLFYGYDFTVLKVFFTAGVTAMVGVLVLSHLGLLNIDIIYINPTFVKAAIVGGLIMGVGFIIGGFCPGTSVCAAAVGRIDAMMFIIGSVIGIFLFTENFSLIEDLFNANNMGFVTIFDVFGISAELFGIILTVVAVVAFVLTNRLENYINKTELNLSKNRVNLYRGMAVTPIVVILLIWITPSTQEARWARVEDMTQDASIELVSMEIDELAFEVIHHAHKYNIIDTRDTTGYKKTIPTAMNIPIEEMDDDAYRSIYKQPYKKNIFISETVEEARKAAIMAKMLGDDNPIILNAGVGDFREEIYSYPEELKDDDPNAYRFRQEAKRVLLQMEIRLKNSQRPVIKKARIVEGGCT